MFLSHRQKKKIGSCERSLRHLAITILATLRIEFISAVIVGQTAVRMRGTISPLCEMGIFRALQATFFKFYIAV